MSFEPLPSQLRLLRKRRALTQAEVARTLGTTANEVWRWEHGHYSRNSATEAHNSSKFAREFTLLNVAHLLVEPYCYLPTETAFPRDI